MGTSVCVVWRRTTEDVFFFFFVVGYAKGGDVWDFIIAVLVIKTRGVNPTTLGGIVFTPLGRRLCGGWWGRSSVKRNVCLFAGRAKTPLRADFPLGRRLCGMGLSRLANLRGVVLNFFPKHGKTRLNLLDFPVFLILEDSVIEPLGDGDI